MTTPFDNWTVQDAVAKIPNRADGWLLSNLDFYAGDHWQGGRAWTGPMLPIGHAQYQTALTNVKTGFVSKNAIAEVVDRHVAGILGRSPHWSLTVKDREKQTAADEALIKEATILLSSWLEGQQGIGTRQRGLDEIKLCNPLEVAQLAVGSSLLTRRGVFRLLVLEQDDREAIKRIFVQHVESNQGGVVIDRATMQKAGIYAYTDTKGLETVELSYLDGSNTVLRITNRQSTKGKQKNLNDEGAYLPLWGRLTIYEMERPALITETVRQQQMALNKAKTMNSRNLDSGGFLERIFLNAQMPGTWADDPDNPGKQKFTPAPMALGPGTANYMVGVETTDADGRKSLSTPSVVYRDPVASTTFIEASDHFYRGILEETDQLHVLIAGDATASGASRVQAKDDYLKSLLTTKGEVDAALTWLLETVLKLSAYLSGQPERFDTLRVSVDSQVDLGIISGDEQQQARDAYKDGVSSRETSMRRIGIQDPDAEAAILDSEVQKSPDTLKLRVDAAIAANLSAEWIWRNVYGMDDEQVALIKEQLAEQNDTGSQVEQPTDIEQ